MKFYAAFWGVFLFLACNTEQKQTKAFKDRMRAEADSLCTFNRDLIEAYKGHQEDLGQLWLMNYRQRLSDRLLFMQYDYVPSSDSLLWISGMHVYRQYHQQTYGLLTALETASLSAEKKDSLRIWETALWERCTTLLSPDFGIPDSCRLYRLMQ